MRVLDTQGKIDPIRAFRMPLRAAQLAPKPATPPTKPKIVEPVLWTFAEVLDLAERQAAWPADQLDRLADERAKRRGITHAAAYVEFLGTDVGKQQHREYRERSDVERRPEWLYDRDAPFRAKEGTAGD